MAVNKVTLHRLSSGRRIPLRLEEGYFFWLVPVQMSKDGRGRCGLHTSYILTAGNYHRIISILHVEYFMQIIKHYNSIISVLPLKCFVFAFLRSKGVGYFYFSKSKPYSVTSVVSLIPE